MRRRGEGGCGPQRGARCPAAPRAVRVGGGLRCCGARAKWRAQGKRGAVSKKRMKFVFFGLHLSRTSKHTHPPVFIFFHPRPRPAHFRRTPPRPVAAMAENMAEEGGAFAAGPARPRAPHFQRGACSTLLTGSPLLSLFLLSPRRRARGPLPHRHPHRRAEARRRAVPPQLDAAAGHDR
jgi:hypothetical protein